MPFFKTTKDIFKTPWEDELYNSNWMDSSTLVLPPQKEWDYSRELQIEDVDVWEQLYYQGGGLAVYAAWEPYAEFYMITKHNFDVISDGVETYYGKGAQKMIQKRIKELGIPIPIRDFWVEPEDMWMYE